MIDYCNRTLLCFAAIYLALLPTNSATFAHSIAFGVAGASAVLAFAFSLRSPATRVPTAGPGVVVPLLAWAGWSVASLAWSINPDYSRGQLEREVMDSLLCVLIFYMAAYNARALRALTVTALASFAFFAVLALALDRTGGAWDASLYHHGVGPWSTWVVMVAPLLILLVGPRPVGQGLGKPWLLLAGLLLALMVITARMTDNRIVWVALAAVFGIGALAAGLRWRHSLVRRPIRFILPLLALLIVLAIAFTDALRERAAHFAPDQSVTTTLERDPRLALWEHLRERIEARVWLGYGFGRRILAAPLARELDNPLLTHAHNAFASQWLQTGLVGMAAFVAMMLGLTARYARFLRASDEALAVIGLCGIALLAGFVVKNLTDDFLFRSNAKEFWALTAMLLGYGVRREKRLALASPKPS